MATSKRILDAAKNLKPGASLLSIPGVTKRDDADKGTITLDRKGVETFAGERSSNVSSRSSREVEEERQRRAVETNKIAQTAKTQSAATTQAQLQAQQGSSAQQAAQAGQENFNISSNGGVKANSDFNTQPEKGGVEGLLANKVNPALQKVLEFFGAEFEEVQEDSAGLFGKKKGDLKMTPKGARKVITSAVIMGATGPLMSYGGAVLSKVGSKVGIKAGTKVVTSTSRAATKASIKKISASPGYINRQAFAHELSAKTGNLIPRGTIQTQRAITGKAFTPTNNVMKMFKRTPTAALKYAVNPKSQAATISVLRKNGFSLGAAGIIAVAGTYPFATFEIAEATDKLGMAMMKAAEVGDTEAVAELTEYLNEITDPGLWGKVISLIPFANVQRAVMKNITAARMSSEVMNEEADRNARIANGEEESPFMAERRMADEAAQIRKDEQRETDEAYYDRLRAESDQRDKDERKEQEDYYAGIRADQDKAEKEKRQTDEKYWNDVYETNLAREKADRDKELKERQEDADYYQGIKDQNALDEKASREEEAKYYQDLADKNKADKAAERAADEEYWNNIKEQNEAERKLYDKSSGREWVGPSNLAFGMLRSGGYYTEEEMEEEKKKQKS